MFAIETGINSSYSSILTNSVFFNQTLQHFFHRNGRGANITAPFKVHALNLCDHITKHASLVGAVNTIVKLPNNLLLGANTDGIGLISDLHHFYVLHKKIKSRVLLVGAGGAARGVIAPLIHNYNCNIILVNRTFLGAKKLVSCYKYMENLSTLPIEQLQLEKVKFDLIINATSADNFSNFLPYSLIHEQLFCYDMCYQQEGDTAFITWCRQHGAKKYLNGLGMLVSQAAYSFLLWHGILPSIIPVLNKLLKRTI
ncbi:dehydroshikimate reductase [Baumannia cicadellinicola str. Hc (Homalodisca coagulata)]|uniref:shikimate dehydrogenase (NADP(+)) n=1 Tax=Baumannia cicadellinicola subsp. Homalodisca coagulata TaxID=374463 RepID=Q1LT54_BAUCH|nr:dehydroshikimate reductase [Baumannia cicadellinicola str. Hc (Homalodisca coagulata)]MCJ7462100.1 shikimate dehydrogenase [Candidatus Baumannia cicadellinicola]MCJ7462890.1 shikimate dehydrogenase [Candidatus Baumannia cicadellinicola]